MDGRYLFIPVISGLIGWFTNFLVLKFLFWPRVPYTIPIINFKIQGVFSRRKADIAKAVSQVVAEELMSKDKLLDSIDKEKAAVDLVKFTETKVESVVDKRLSLIVPSSIKKRISRVVTNIINDDLNTSVREGIDKLLKEGKDQIDVGEMIENQILSLDIEEVEDMTFRIAKKEFKFIEIFGGVLGVIIGIFQLIVLRLI